MVQSAAEGDALVNHPEILLRHPLGSRWAVEWLGGGASLSPSALGTWCPWGLVVLPGVGLGRRRGVLSSRPHGIELFSAVAVHVIQSDLTQNSSDPLSPLSQTTGGPTQGRNCSTNTTIYPVRPATKSSCGGSAAAAWNDLEGQPGRRMPGRMPPVGSAGFAGSRCPRSSLLWRWNPSPGIGQMTPQDLEGDHEWTGVSKLQWARSAVHWTRFHRSPRLARGSASTQHSIRPAATSQTGPPPLALPRPQCLPPGITRRRNPGSYGSMPRLESLFTSSASGCSYQDARPGWPGGGGQMTPQDLEGDHEWTGVSKLQWARSAVHWTRFHRSPRLARGSASTQHSIRPAATSQTGPPPLALPRPQCLPPGITRRRNPGSYGSMPRLESLFTSSASGCSYQDARPGWPGGGWSLGRTRCCMFRG